MKTKAGTLIVVVGPSGAGKDTLIAAAKAQLAGDPRFHFPRRAVTREAFAALEDHDSVSVDAFEAQLQAGAFALTWEAHGLRYGVPVSIDAILEERRSVVVNVSRKVIAKAREKYPRCAVILIDASIEVRTARLARRGREAPGEIAARLRREVAALPEGVAATQIENSGLLEVAVAAFTSTLIRLAA